MTYIQTLTFTFLQGVSFIFFNQSYFNPYSGKTSDQNLTQFPWMFIWTHICLFWSSILVGKRCDLHKSTFTYNILHIALYLILHYNISAFQPLLWTNLCSEVDPIFLHVYLDIYLPFLVIYFGGKVL